MLDKPRDRKPLDKGLCYALWFLWAEDNAIGWIYSQQQISGMFKRMVEEVGDAKP